MLQKMLTATAVLAVSACGGGGSSDSGGSSQSDNLSSADYSSRVVDAEISRRDSGVPMSVSGLPLDGTSLMLTDD